MHVHCEKNERVITGLPDEPEGVIHAVRRFGSVQVAGVGEMLRSPYGCRVNSLGRMITAELEFRDVKVPECGISFSVEYYVPLASRGFDAL